MYYRIRINDSNLRGVIETSALLAMLKKNGFKSVGKAPEDLNIPWDSLFISTHDKKFAIWANVSADMQGKAKEIPIAQLGQALLDIQTVEREEEADQHELKIGVLVSATGYAKPMLMQLCVACMRQAVAGDEDAIKRYSNPHVVRMLIADFLEHKGISLVPDEEADAKLEAKAFEGSSSELYTVLHDELQKQDK